MNIDDFQRKEENRDLIPGIHNYCDRWCERCFLSSRCSVFISEHKSSENIDSNDISNKEFWNQLADTFALTLNMLEKIVGEYGIDVEAVKQASKERKSQKRNIEDHTISQLADRYFHSAHGWLKAHEDAIDETLKNYKRLAILGIDEESNADIFITINDLVEITSWYLTIIPVKAKRAVNGLLEDDVGRPIQNDANGTAKVVLISVDRCIFAWNGLLKYFPENSSSILENIAILKQLKRQIRVDFPNAEKFIRPGFDEL